MATKKSTGKSKAKSKTATRSAKRAPTNAGPISLEEARALAIAEKPKRAPRRAAALAETNATLGAERQRLISRRESERSDHIRDYTAIMKLMKERGAKAPGRTLGVAGHRRAPVTGARSFQPLQVFAEGDSWFHYPVPLFGGGIIRRLEPLLGVPILNLASAGDEVRFMLGVEQRKRLAQALSMGCPAGGTWDALLFSGGGNDIVDNPMALWIRDWDPTASSAALINQPRFDAALALVRAGYEDLIQLRDSLSPNTHLLFHGYDFAIPDGRGVCNFGPWLKPTFSLRGFPTAAGTTASFPVVKLMLQQFAAMLTVLAAAHTNVTFIDSQNTLNPTPASWHNELHPNKAGFETLADLFRQTLRTMFPGRVA